MSLSGALKVFDLAADRQFVKPEDLSLSGVLKVFDLAADRQFVKPEDLSLSGETPDAKA